MKDENLKQDSDRSAKPNVWTVTQLVLLVVGLLVLACILLTDNRPADVAKKKNDLPAKDDLNHSQSGDIANNKAPHRAEVIPLDDHEAQDVLAGHFADESKGRVLVVRGIFTVFSLGMDDLAKKLRKQGYQVHVTTAAKSSHTAKSLRDDIQRPGNHRPLIIIGHSLGGDLAPKLAGVFAEKNVPVDMLIMLDSTMPSSPPKNVKRCVNMYQSNGTPDWARVFRGTRINAKSDQTEMINIDIRKLAGKEKTAGINHFNIDANPWIHDLIIETVKQTDPTNHSRRQTESTQFNSSRISSRAFRFSDQVNSGTQPYYRGQSPQRQAPRSNHRRK